MTLLILLMSVGLFAVGALLVSLLVDRGGERR